MTHFKKSTERKYTSLPLFVTFLLLLAVMLGACRKEKIEEEVREQVPVPIAMMPQGDLTADSIHGPFVFRTNGGGTITIALGASAQVKITHDDFPAFHLECWAVDTNDVFYGHHEGLNYVHLKDRLTNCRTIIFPDGAKVTMTALPGDYDNALVTISIYDLEESHRIDVASQTLIHSSTDVMIAKQYDSAEPDGEAGGFDITDSGLLFFNDYTEDTPGNFVFDHYNLGEIYFDLPSAISDYYDDPRYQHT